MMGLGPPCRHEQPMFPTPLFLPIPGPTYTPKGASGTSFLGAPLPPMALGFPTSWPAEGVVSVVWSATAHFP